VGTDAIIELRFKTTAEGGRQTDLFHESGEYRCALFINEEAFDCRIFYDNRVQLGSLYKLPVRFLSPDLALRKLSRGCSIRLWEGKDVATGTVLEVRAPDVSVT
jgi:hypothetical protein